MLHPRRLPFLLASRKSQPQSPLPGHRLTRASLSDPGEPAIISAAILVLVACGVAASVIPARRAASIDPLQALRTE